METTTNPEGTMTTKTPVPPRAKAYYRMASTAHAKGDHELGNHWYRQGREIEKTAALNRWHDDHVCPDD